MFQNREEAGRLLAKRLNKYKNNRDAIILAIPRGGVVVGKQITTELHLPLNVIVVKKISSPSNPELAIGAVTSSGTKIIDWDLVLRIGVEQGYLDQEIRKKQKEAEERVKKLKIKNVTVSAGSRNGGKKLKIEKKKIIILVDDGVATGATTLAAIKYIKESVKRKALSVKIILAVPVIAQDTFNRLKSEVDELEVLEIPPSFGSVGQFYREFPQVTDEEVINILSDNRQQRTDNRKCRE